MNIQALPNPSIVLKIMLGLSMFLASMAARSVDLTNNPMTTSTATAVKPNIMFVLDDSGSMGWDFMPDYVSTESNFTTGLCKQNSTTGWGNGCVPADPPYFSAGFNGMFYNPTINYVPPVNADGTSKTNLSITAAKSDPFLNPSNTDNLQTSFRDVLWCTKTSPTATERGDSAVCRAPVNAAGLYAYPNNTYKERVDITGGPYYYNLTGGQWCTTWGFTACQANWSPTYNRPKYGTFSRFNITSSNCSPKCPSGRTYADELTNFANWYGYYGTRMDMMKSAAGRAFAGLDENYRVGFMTIHTTGTGSKFLNIKNFEASQKTSWYDLFYGIIPNSGTPLRSALSLAGKMYAGKALNVKSGVNIDPVQYSCQKNFTILSTDGLWNGDAGSTLDGSAIGNIDANASKTPRPKLDALNGSDTLADTAWYYYDTDLRTPALGNCTSTIPGVDLCVNNVPPSKKDPSSKQHQTLFTVGLGVNGVLDYRTDYETATTGDFVGLKTGIKNWPVPAQNNPTTIDDLWHAAVNAGGTYYSAKNPQALVDGLGDALREVGSRFGAAAAASTSNPQVTTLDNFVFSATYRTGYWDSTLTRTRIDPLSGQISDMVEWEAGSLLNAKDPNTRKIYMFSSAAADAATKLKEFRWANISASPEAALLNVNAWSDPVTKLSQWATLSAAGQTAAKSPDALVNYLRGDTTLEDDTGSPDKPFRGRENILGDIVNAETRFLGKSDFTYDDAGHIAFVEATKTRGRVLFAAANDGMLHAFNADSGQELWAYMPTPVLPNLHKLADKNYLHEFYADATPAVGDFFDGTNWRTILVAGLNKGGKGYYALDVTNPLAPKALWEVCQSGCSQTLANLGYTYGNPVITKLGGQWKVLVTSGYNNTDGLGYLWALNPVTGVPSLTMTTSCTGPNCGLAKIAPWLESYKNNSALRVYGGDLNGNLWRFDVNGGGTAAFKLAQFGAPPGLIQSITTKPSLAQVPHNGVLYDVVFVGTGRFIGISDKADTGINSFYAVVDDHSNTSRGIVRTNDSLVKQDLTAGESRDGRAVYTNSNKTVDWTTKSGWYIDLPNTGERSFTDPAIALGTITFTTNIPKTGDPCSGGGVSWLYELDWRTGGSVLTAETTSDGKKIAGSFFANEYATRGVVVQLLDGKLISLVQLNNGKKVSDVTPVKETVAGRRGGWRQILE